MHCGAAPPGWQRPELDDRDWNSRADAGREARQRRARSKSMPAKRRRRRRSDPAAGARFARWHFAVGAELPSLETLTLRIRYTHGFAAYLNGVEIARRRLDPARAARRARQRRARPRVRVVHRARARPAPRRQRARGRGPSAHRRPRHHRRAVAARRRRRAHRARALSARPARARSDASSSTPTCRRSAEVRWGRDDDYGSSAHDGFGTHHVIRLTGLKPGTVYHYRVRVRPQRRQRPQRASSTPATPSSTRRPTRGRPLRFVVYGDVRSGHDIHARSISALAERIPTSRSSPATWSTAAATRATGSASSRSPAPLLRTAAPSFPRRQPRVRAARAGRLAPSCTISAGRSRAGEDEPPWYYSFDIGRRALRRARLQPVQLAAPARLVRARSARGAPPRRARACSSTRTRGPARRACTATTRSACTTTCRSWSATTSRCSSAATITTTSAAASARSTTSSPAAAAPSCAARAAASPASAPARRASLAFVNEHNYVMVEVLPSLFRVCPKRVDGTPIEACTQYPLR